MKSILGRESVGLLSELAWSKVLLGFDFDGTLAPIVEDRDAAVMSARTSALFARVAELYPCAVISGRSRPDVAKRLGRARVKYVIGNHGLEPGAGLGAFERQIAVARDALAESLQSCAGVEIEDKRYSLAVHYRRARLKREARNAIAAAIARLDVEMRTIAGKLVVNVVPARAPNKADALLQLRAKEQADVALYVGDDVTDEDVFELDQPGRLLSIRVGESKSSAAKYFLRNQREIDTMLELLGTLRPVEHPR
ncbi:MAG: trehalose-phosphatase [Polyangiaceae bacterium]